MQAVATEFRRDPRRHWSTTFNHARNARIIPLVGDFLYKEEEYYLADDVGVIPAQSSAAEGVIETLKYAPQFLPDIGIWGKQLQDAWRTGGDVIDILREWYKENEQKLREGKFQEIRPGRVPVVKAVDSREAVKDPTEGYAAGQPPKVVATPGVSAVAETAGTPAWVLWGSGIFAILLALGVGVRRFLVKR